MSAANGGNGNGGNGGGGVGGGFLLLAPPSYRSTKTLCFCSVVTVVVVFSVTVIVPFWVSVLSGDWVDTTNWDGSMGRTCPSSPAVSAAAAGAAAQLDSASMPFWSRGFARSCCTSYPKRFVKHYKGYFEAGDLTDPLYFLKYRRHIRDGDILYVAVADVPRFTRVFSELPQDVRITLVTGQEDIGAPYEIFHPNRPGHKHYRMSELWAWPNTQRMTMREFLADKRLHRWYVQNYDLVGCNAFTCSDIDPVEHADIVGKVVPIPIGVDFHSNGEKNKLVNTAGKITSSVCFQRADLKAAVSASPPFAQRKLAVYGQFDCNKPDPWGTREVTRGEICRLLRNATITDPTRYLYDQRKSRQQFWKQLTSVAFSVAPAGFGVDTHRFWEILNLHTVPIVITSPLDKLYGQYPVVIVEHWTQVFADGALEKFRQQIVDKFGEVPFARADVLEKLNVDYWVKLVKEGGSIPA